MLTKNKQNNARLYCNNLKNFDVTIPDSARVRKHSNEDRDRRRKLTPPLREGEGKKTEAEDCLVVKEKTTELVFETSRRNGRYGFAGYFRN